MKILIRKQNRPGILLLIPMRLVLNSGTARIAAKALEKEQIGLDRARLENFVCAFRKCQKQYRGLQLVEVQSSDGITVKITL